MEMRIVFALAVAAVLVLSAYMIISRQAAPGDYDAFAQCLTSSGAVMYGTEWCSHCQDQKGMFGKSFDYVDFVDCDASALCTENGITGYPTWIINNIKYTGTKSLEELSAISGCALG